MRYLRARARLEELLSALGYHLGVSAVAYEEGARHAGVSAAHVYGGVIAVVSSLCEQNRIPYCGVPVGTVKKRATGRGNASKADMVAAAVRRWDIAADVSTDEADALWIAETFRQQEL